MTTKFMIRDKISQYFLCELQFRCDINNGILFDSIKIASNKLKSVIKDVNGFEIVKVDVGFYGNTYVKTLPIPKD